MSLLDAEHSCRTIGGSETSGIEVHLLDLDRVGPIEPQDVLDDERARSERFHKPEDGQHFLARRVLLRQLLSARTGRDPRDLGSTPDAFGRPCIAGLEPVRFNTSRSRNWYAVAIHAGPDGMPGVDIEQARELPDPGPLSRRILSPGEQAVLGAGVTLDVDRLLRVWTRKEAVLKAVGRGLAIDPSLVTVTLDPDVRNGLVRLEDPQEEASWDVRLWDVTDERVPDGLILSVACASTA